MLFLFFYLKTAGTTPPQFFKINEIVIQSLTSRELALPGDPAVVGLTCAGWIGFGSKLLCTVVLVLLGFAPNADAGNESAI